MMFETDVIENHVVKTVNWNPSKVIPNEKISYIDLSSIDKEKKVLVEELVQIVPSIDAPSRARQKTKKGDILVATVRPNLNSVAIIKSDLKNLTSSTGYSVLRPKESLDKNFLFYWLQTKSFINDMVKKATGANYPAVSDSIIKKSKIPLPPLATQKKIAAILDAADAHRQKTKQLLAKYDELAQSIFLEMFGDSDNDRVSLSELVKINPKKSEISSLDKETKVSFVPMADVSEEGDMNNTLTRKISEVWSGFTYFREDDVVFAKITPCMENGKGAIARSLVNGVAFGTTEFHVLRPIEGISKSSWIFQLTHGELFRRLAESNMTGSAGQKRVPKEFFTKFKINKPDYKDQEKFESILNSIYAQKIKIKMKIEQSENLFNSLLQKAFKGELVK